MENKSCPYCKRKMEIVKSISTFYDENKTIEYEEIRYECKHCEIKLWDEELLKQNLQAIKKKLGEGNVKN